jgi:hypothetical protein
VSRPIEANEPLAFPTAPERTCPVTAKRDDVSLAARRRFCGDSPIPVDLAPTPLMRRFTEIWIAQIRSQNGFQEEAS